MSTKHKHRPCPCGCGDMADECMSPHAWRNPFGAFQIVEPSPGTRPERVTTSDNDADNAKGDA